MKTDFKAYLDGFNKVTIIISKSLCNKSKIFCLIRETDVVDLTIIETISLGEFNKYVCSITENIMLHKDYNVIDESENKCVLRPGKIVRSEMFDMTYMYNGWLGFKYSKEETTFKIWSPVCKEVEIELISPSDKIAYYDLTYVKQGVWQVSVSGDLEKYKYRYNIRVFDQFETVNDPYGVSASADGEYNYVVDLSKACFFVNEKPHFSGHLVDSIIYEASVRDFSMSPTSGAVYKGKFLGASENHPTKLGYPTGLSYLNFLGITHLQLLPIFDFGGVYELDPKKAYNWGYNPENYNIPEGSYATNPNDPYSRISELCSLIDSCHANNIRVVMDVVYNHVYEIDKFCLNKLVPGYFFRVDENHMLSNASGCGNDLATERKMLRKYIVDSVLFWAKNYNISGFRFDLMGLMDVKTMNLIKEELHKIDNTIVLYGEGWNIPNTLDYNQKPTMCNYELVPSYGFFNDRFRDYIRGNQWNHTLGFSNGAHFNVYDLTYLFTGSCIDKYLFDDPNRSINYVECHDNYTFYDYTKLVSKNITKKDLINYQALAIAIVVLSQGVPFIHAGMEFLRSKQGVENSYKSSDKINEFNWDERDEHIEIVLMLKELIKLRKSISEFRCKSQKEISDKISFLGQRDKNKAAMFKIVSKDYLYYLVVKNNYEKEELEVKDFVMIFDGRMTCEVEVDNIVVDKPGVTIYRRVKV